MMNNPIFKFFSSLRLTAVLMLASVILIFFGTLDQVQYGINMTQELYFQGFLAVWKYPPQWYFSDILFWVYLPIPGGYTIGPLILINLVCAHFRFFRPTWKNVGLMPIHGGVALLLISQFITDMMQEEFFMWLDEGASSNFATSFNEDELVIIETTDTDIDKIVSIPGSLLEKGESFQHVALPIRVDVKEYFPNANISRAQGEIPEGYVTSDKGVGKRLNLVATEIDPTFKQNDRNMTTAIVEIFSSDGSLGTWMVSNVFEEQVPPQVFSVGDRSFEISLRYLRKYFPFTITLNDFTHDRYPGTEIPMNFSSKIELLEEGATSPMETLIYMNNPLRHSGYTFFQASFANQDRSSMFQIVSNPGWLVPYISLLMVTIGMLYEFGVGLTVFLGRRFKS